MVEPALRDAALGRLVCAIRERNGALALRLLAASPDLAKASFISGAGRRTPKPYYAGDTALHAEAAVYDAATVRKLIAMGADIRARNRRGSEPLHSAAVGQPGSETWNPAAQAETVAALIAAGADPNATNMDEVTPLHRAVRTRCAAAVRALLEGGADIGARNKHGSRPTDLATRNTGRGGSGSASAKAELREIVRLFAEHGNRVR